MNKVLIKLYIPMMEQKYDIWIPINKRICNVIKLLVQVVNNLTKGYYTPNNTPTLYDKATAKAYDSNKTVKESNIINGTELILI